MKRKALFFINFELDLSHIPIPDDGLLAISRLLMNEKHNDTIGVVMEGSSSQKAMKAKEKQNSERALQILNLDSVQKKKKNCLFFCLF